MRSAVIKDIAEVVCMVIGGVIILRASRHIFGSDSKTGGKVN